jgi:deoxyadenosine/deoxycytidine kinase
MNSRNRKEESGVSMEYLEQLHDKHEKWFAGTNDRYMTISGDTDFENDQLYLSQMIESINNMISAEQSK